MVADCPLFVSVTVMIAVPAATAVTLIEVPDKEAVAILVSLLRTVKNPLPEVMLTVLSSPKVKVSEEADNSNGK